MTSRLLGYRRSLAIGTVWAAAMIGLVVTSPSASGQEAGVEPGLGNAYAQGYKVDPRTGRLSFGITYGMALAGHQNTVAVAESRSVDLGVIGTTLAGQKCDGGDPTFPKEDQPQPLEARSTEEDAGEPKSETEHGVEKHALATSDPLARAVAITAAAGDPAALQVGSTVSETTSGIVDGVRQARAVTEVDKISFAGGQVVLTGLRWEAVWQSAPQETVDGTFTMDGIRIADQGLGLPVGENEAATLAEANQVLQPLGFVIEPPQVRKESGIAFVDPMRIGIVPSDARESALAPVFDAFEDPRESLFDAIIEQDCANASYLTVFDIVLGSVTGAGSLNLEVGGVTASSDDLRATSFLGALPDLGSLPPVNSGSVGGGSLPSAGSSGPSLGGSSPDLGASSPSPSASGSSASESGGGEEESALPAVNASSVGSRGGPLVGVGLGGLALLAALAEADRRKMRRAQRSVPMEVLA